ncbi:ArsR/SmtB family transcription factor [Poriferisphaera sp. WC338]|uniref:ArsR/SmtB family transcription factor n=1 Tax=Poriferisphaera sp. WC338 TaxID=3425129 RepID=UPI003D818D1B
MKEYLNITKALSDETRVRALMMLDGQELCLCEIIDILKLAPSTVSKHMSLLYTAGLIHRRKQGKWQYYRLADTESDCPTTIKSALAWTRTTLADTKQINQDKQTRCCSKDKELEELCACYRS